MRRRRLAFALIASGWGGAEAAPLAIGDALLDLPSDRFALEGWNGANGRVVCRTAECEAVRGGVTIDLAVSRDGDADAACTPDQADLAPRTTGFGRLHYERLVVNGIGFDVTVEPSQCRARAAPFAAACGRVGRTVISFSHGGLGCNSRPPLPMPLLREILRGVHPAAR